MAQFEAVGRGNFTFVTQQVNVDNVNEKDIYERTLLHYACIFGNISVLDYLVGLKANVNFRDIVGRTPLSYASAGLYPNCVKRLLTAGADASIPDYKGTLPLHSVCKSVEITTLFLVAYPKSANTVDKYRDITLHCAARYGTFDVCRLLLDAGSFIDKLNNDDRTPLCVALRRGDRDIAELLLDRGARLKRVRLDKYLTGIPQWALEFVSHRNACKEITKVVTSLRKLGMDPNLFKMLGKYVWNTRRDDKWGLFF